MSNIEIINLIDNSPTVKAAFDAAMQRALEAIGGQAETYAVNLAPVGTPESTGVYGYHGGTLKQSISHTVIKDAAYIGTNTKYAPYVEWGTGNFADPEGIGSHAKRIPWYYKDQNGKWHKTFGIRPKHFLKKAVENHKEEYKKILENEMKNA